MVAISLPTVNNASSMGVNSTAFFPIGSASSQKYLTESQTQVVWRQAGTFSNMYAFVNTNSVTANTIITYRVGAANGNQILTYASSTAGELTDVTNTDIASAGNNINYEIVTGATGSTFGIPIRHVIQFAPTLITNTVNKLVCASGANTPLTDTSVGTSYYNSLTGYLAKSTTEANAQFTNKLTATLQNLFINVSANTASVATVDSRIGGANGNLTVSITSGTTGHLEDTTHTDSISSGNLVNTALNATVVTTITITIIAVDCITTNATTHYIDALSTGITIPASQTLAAPITGDDPRSGNDTTLKLKPALAFTASNLESYVITNTLTGTGVWRFKKNASNGNQVITYNASVTGYLEDTTHNDSVSATDEVNYGIVTGTGTSLIYGTVGILATYPMPVTVLNWFPVYDADVIAFPTAVRFSQLAMPIIPDPIKQTDWYAFYTPEIMPWPTAAQYSTIAQKILPSPITQTDWFPAYEAQTQPRLKAAQFSYYAELLPTPIGQIDWYPSYAAQVNPYLKAAQYSTIAKPLYLVTSITNWYPTYDAVVKPAALRAQFSLLSQLLPKPITIINWYPDYSAEVKIGPLAARFSLISQASLNSIGQSDWYPIYDSQVKAAPLTSQYSTFAETLKPPIGLNNWYPIYPAEIKRFIRAVEAVSTTPPLIIVTPTGQVQIFWEIDSDIFSMLFS